MIYLVVCHLTLSLFIPGIGASPALGLNFRKFAELFWHEPSAMRAPVLMENCVQNCLMFHGSLPVIPSLYV